MALDIRRHLCFTAHRPASAYFVSAIYFSHTSRADMPDIAVDGMLEVTVSVRLLRRKCVAEAHAAFLLVQGRWCWFHDSDRYKLWARILSS